MMMMMMMMMMLCWLFSKRPHGSFREANPTAVVVVATNDDDIDGYHDNDAIETVGS